MYSHIFYSYPYKRNEFHNLFYLFRESLTDQCLFAYIDVVSQKKLLHTKKVDEQMAKQ